MEVEDGEDNDENTRDSDAAPQTPASFAGIFPGSGPDNGPGSRPASAQNCGNGVFNWMAQPSMLAAMQRYYGMLATNGATPPTPSSLLLFQQQLAAVSGGQSAEMSPTDELSPKEGGVTQAPLPSSKPRFGSSPAAIGGLKLEDGSGDPPPNKIKKRTDRCDYCGKVRRFLDKCYSIVCHVYTLKSGR